MQESQFPQATSEVLDATERAVLRQRRMRRLRAALITTGVLAFGFFVTGCPEPADMDNPNTFPGGTGGSATAGTGGSGPNCEQQCVTDVFSKTVASCKLCHASKPAPEGLQSSGLDLQTPGYTARMKDVLSKHTDLTAPATAADCPTGDKLIDTATPGASWLWKKLTDKQGPCGTKMPQPPTTLKVDELACMKTYIECVAGKPLVETTGGAGGGSSGGGGAGGGAAAGGGAGGASGGGAGGNGGASGGGAGGNGGTGGA